MTPRPGRNSKIYDIDLPRPRPLSITAEPHFFEIVAEIKQFSILRTTGDARLSKRTVEQIESRYPQKSPISLLFFLLRPRKRAKKKGAARRGAGFSVNHLGA